MAERKRHTNTTKAIHALLPLSLDYLLLGECIAQIFHPLILHVLMRIRLLIGLLEVHVPHLVRLVYIYINPVQRNIKTEIGSFRKLITLKMLHATFTLSGSYICICELGIVFPL